MSGALKCWRLSVVDQISARINQELNGGGCPGAGALGECPACYEETRREDGFAAWFVAEVFLWRSAADVSAATLAGWVEAAGGIDPVVCHVLHDDWNEVRAGLCSDGARWFSVRFKATRPEAAEGDAPISADGHAALMQAVEDILNDGHMNQEHLARLRAAWERS